ncbi:MAG: nitroreductase family protein, partial [Streptosporangiaceae bacterium]
AAHPRLAGMEFTEVLKRRRMVRAFTAQPLPEGITNRLLRAAERAPSAGFSQGYSFLVLSGQDEAAPLWQVFYDNAVTPGSPDDEVEQLNALVKVPVIIVPLACKDIYLSRYAESDKGWTDKDEERWPVPYWYVDTGFAALLMMLAVVDAGLGHVFFSIPPTHIDAFRAAYGVPPERMPIGALAVGYPDPANDPVGPARGNPRKPLADLVHHARW